MKLDDMKQAQELALRNNALAGAEEDSIDGETEHYFLKWEKP